MIKNIKKKLISFMGPFFAYWTIKILGKTIRFEEVNPEIPKSIWMSGNPAIGAFWHGRLLMMPFAYKGKRLSFLVSPHRDGQIVGKALIRFGFIPILGSSDKQGSYALNEMVNAIENGSDIAIVPDGPKGPRYRVKFGVIELARRTGRPIVPVTFSSSKKKIFNSWDKFLLPFPFSKGVFIWGEPIYVDKDGNRSYLEEKRLLLEKRLNDLTEMADNYFTECRQNSKNR